MGCAASTETAAQKEKRPSRGRRNKTQRRGAANSDDESEVTPSNPETRGSQQFDEVGVTTTRTGRHASEDDLSDISSCDLGQSTLRATASSAHLRGGKGLDAELQEAEVDLEEEFFEYDDINVDLKDMRAKISARKNMAGARDKTILSKAPVGGAIVGGPRGANASAFVFNDFTIEDSATLDMLGESMRGHGHPHHHKKEEKEKITKELSVILRRPPPDRPKRPPGDIKGFSLSTRIGHSSRVKCLAIAPGEREYVSCSNDDSIVTYYDVRTSQELGIFSGHQDTVIHAVFSPCGKFLATTSRDNTLVLWDVVTQKALLTFEHGKVVICCAFSRSSRFIATGCQDKVCRLWECRRGRELVAFTQHEGIIIALSIAPDESHVVSASADKTLRIWSVAKGRAKAILRGHSHIILACNYNNEGDKIVSNDERSVRIWQAPGGQQLRCIMVEDLIKLRNPPPNKKQSWTLSCLAPKAFPRHIIVASNNRMVFVIDMDSGDEGLSVDTKAPVYCLAPGHRNLIAYGDSFGNVYFLRLECFDEEEPTDDRPGGADWA